MESRRAGLGTATVALAVIIVVMVAAIGILLLTPNPSSTENSGTSTTLVIDGINLWVPQNQPSSCQAPPAICAESNIQVSGTASVDSNTPLSCLDVYVNGSSEGSACWNVTSPAFTTTECNETGNQTSCSLVINSNTNTETARAAEFDVQLSNGTDNSPLIFAGKSYQITLVSVFQDGSNSTASAVVVATINNSLTVSVVSITTATSEGPGSTTSANVDSTTT
jgi:hypothetical protein